MSYKLTRKDKGFTIIEVMIVLAIAALILLAVFLAIPNLQRSSRNSSRKNDAGRIGTAATNFPSNNNGTLPTAAGNAATILNDAGTLAQYVLTPQAGAAGNCVIGSGANNAFNICKYNAAVTLTPLTSGQDGMVLATGAACGANGGDIALGTARQMALYYTVETSGAPTWACQGL